MKKFICALLAMMLLLSILSGCNKEEQATAGNAAPSGTTADTADTTVPGGLENNNVFDNQDPQTQASTQPTYPAQSESTEGTKATEATSPTESAAGEGPASIDYETFKAMTGAEKKAYQESFESIDAFFEWYNAALKAYQDANPPTVVDGSGNVTLPNN